MTFRRGYALAAAMIFLVEVVIAMFVRDRFVRPYLGDVLAVILLYCAIPAVMRAGVATSAGAALLVGVIVELGQYAGFVDRIGLGNSPVARTVFGTGFEPWDFAAYAAGALIAVAIEAASGWRSFSGATGRGWRRAD